MRFAKLLRLATLLTAVAAGLPAMALDPNAGRKLAEQHCVRCHAIGPSDKSKLPIAPPFRTIADNLADFMQSLEPGWASDS